MRGDFSAMSFTSEFESEDELELEPVILRSYGEEEGSGTHIEEPYQWPQWPTGRKVNPPPQTVPAGPYQTSVPCRAVEDDFQRLTLAVGELKSLLRQTPPNVRSIGNRADVVTALARRIVNQLQELWYGKKGCTRQHMNQFASLVNTMRGPGADANIGSWPRATSAAVQGPRKQARESLRHLVNWIRRAVREFPGI
jgi:hypothetical protein